MRMKGFQEYQDELPSAEPDCAGDKMASAATTDTPSGDVVGAHPTPHTGPTLRLADGGLMPNRRSQLNSERVSTRSESRGTSEFLSRLWSETTETKRRSITARNNLHSYLKQEIKPLFRTGYNAVEVHRDDNDCVVTTAIRRKST